MDSVRRSGRVVQFDAFVGLGTIDSDGGESYPFHCVSIADGSRDIAVGTAVTFTVAFHVARDEAMDIRPATNPSNAPRTPA